MLLTLRKSHLEIKKYMIRQIFWYNQLKMKFVKRTRHNKLRWKVNLKNECIKSLLSWQCDCEFRKWVSKFRFFIVPSLNFFSESFEMKIMASKIFGEISLSNGHIFCWANPSLFFWRKNISSKRCFASL